MDLKSGYPFWAIKNGLMHAFPALGADEACEVAVIGAGITGALVAYELARHGHEVVVLEQRDVGWGSTAASTALLQYEIDTHLVDLARKHGETAAVQAYRACADAIGELRALCKPFPGTDFAMQGSLYFASSAWQCRGVRREFEIRERHGFDVEWIDRATLARDYAIDAPGAILNHPAARVDAYQLAYHLLARLRRRGGRIYDRTRVGAITPRRGGVELALGEGLRVRAQHVVVAAGYAAQRWLPHPVARNRSSYAFITDPLPREHLAYLADTLVWESARPYLYVRSTGDGRLLVGGEDDAIDLPARRDRRVDKKQRVLQRRFEATFPWIECQPAFAWAGTFAETRDGLPYFGPHASLGPRVHFAMAYGGNGITYSRIGADLLRAGIEKRRHPLAALFSFDRDG